MVHYAPYILQKKYFSLCLHHAAEYESLLGKIKEYENKAVDSDEQHILDMNLWSLYEKREWASLSPIVFAVMTVEAFLYDYGAQHLGDSYMKKHIDKIDVVSKIVVLTKLITQKDFPVESQAYQGVVELVRARNGLVHFKSKKMTSLVFKEFSDFRTNQSVRYEKAMYSSIDAVRNLMKEIDKMHGFPSHYQGLIEPTQCHA